MRNRCGGAALLLCFVACSSKVALTENSAAPSITPCVTGAGVTTLYEGYVAGIGVAGDQVIIAGGGSILRVPLAGGPPVTLAVAESPSGLLVANGFAYFTAVITTGAPNAQGRTPQQVVVESVPVAGGSTSPISGIDFLNLTTGVTDATSLYVATYSSAVAEWTPPAPPVTLALDRSILIDAIAPLRDYIYVAGQELTSGGLSNGLIERVAKSGGPAQRVASGIGHPWSLVADMDGLYWQQDPPTITGNGAIVRSRLDGSAATKLVETSASSLAVSDGRLYFAAGDIESVPTSGGRPTLVAGGLQNPGMLFVAGGNLVWVDPASQALSGTAVPKVMTTCR